MFRFLRERRRARTRSAPFPTSWEAILHGHVPYFRKLPDAQRALLREHVAVLLDEKNFEGCAGLKLTDRERIIIAAYAALLLIGRKHDFYPGLYSVLVYPEAFAPKRYNPETLDFEGDSDDLHEGESWGTGTVILSWDDIELDTEAFDGRNVVLHEFAHQLWDNDPHILGEPAAEAEWLRVFREHFESHASAVSRGLRVFLDEYGAEEDAEFFSVVTEAFFERPLKFRERYPVLYQNFAAYYGQDPATYFAPAQQ